jgi:hypothetical protein
LFIGLGIEQIGCEKRQAIDNYQIALGTVLSDRLGQGQRFFHGLPVGGTATTMAVDFPPHLIVRGLRCGHENNPAGTLAQLLRVVAFAATHSS